MASKVGPLAQVGLAKDDGPGRSQSFDNEGIAEGGRALQRERSCGRRHAIRGRDVVLDEHRYAMEWPAGSLRLPLGIERLRNRERLRVGFDHGMERRPAVVHRFDPREILLRNTSRRVFPRLHSIVKIRHGRLVQLEWRDRRSW